MSSRQQCRYADAMIGVIGPAAALPSVKAHAAAREGTSDEARSAPTDVRAQGQTNSGQAVVASSANTEVAVEVQRAMLAFQSGDAGLATRELAPLVAQGSAVAAYDLTLIGAPNAGGEKRQPAHAPSSQSSASRSSGRTISLVV
jgi:hypothetical protein